jgi:predicted alpha/beta-fold hydrolase
MDLQEDLVRYNSTKAKDYVQELIVEVAKFGYNSVVMNYRGCAGTAVVTPQLYSGGFTEDVRECIKHILKRDPALILAGVGFSLGANIMTKYCGEEATNCPLIACISVCNPYDLMIGVRALHRTWMGKNVFFLITFRFIPRNWEKI